jgi:Kazal-type serine protease inhibitor domain
LNLRTEGSAGRGPGIAASQEPMRTRHTTPVRPLLFIAVGILLAAVLAVTGCGSSDRAARGSGGAAGGGHDGGASGGTSGGGQDAGGSGGVMGGDLGGATGLGGRGQTGGISGSGGRGGSSGGAGTGASGTGGRGETGGAPGSGGTRDAGQDAALDGGGSCICSMIYAPVCGVNGQTYGNACAAQCEGVAIAHQGVCADAAVDSGGDAGTLGFCNTDNDCMVRRAGCCDGCLALADPPVPSPIVCTVSCPIRPGGCSCINHVCTTGVLTRNAGCDPQHDACGLGLKCCQTCSGAAPVDGASACTAPVCSTTFVFSGGLSVCLAPP